MNKQLILLITLHAILHSSYAALIQIETTGNATFTVDKIGDKLQLQLVHNGIQKLSGDLGLSTNLQNITTCIPTVENCLDFNDGSILQITNPSGNIFSLSWSTTNTSKAFQDCYDLNTTTTHWYGGPERFIQRWPIEKLTLKNFPNIVSDMVDGEWGAVVEPYWLNSQGAFLYADERTPLFIDQNNFRAGAVCFGAKAERPYRARTRVILNYTLAVANNPRDAHLLAVDNFLGKPTSHPNQRIIENPIWSTWARYKREINDTIVLNFAQEIRDNGYVAGQLEIDDNWETCYGSLTFKTPQFTNIDSTVSTLKSMNFSVTLWVHPFVNLDCEEYTQIGLENNYFVKNESGSVLTSWWNSQRYQAQHIDFTNTAAKDWYVNRLEQIRTAHGIDSFKVDAGETTWAPQVPVLTGDVELSPNLLTQEYIRACEGFGDLMEMRVGWKTQQKGFMVRMLDKDSGWAVNNGLYTVITTLLQMNLNGYTMVLPDMIGGNGYLGAPGAELFVRWLQATTFMPTLQFSYVPWDYVNEPSMDVVSISRKFVDLHSAFSGEILKAMENSTTLGYPVNAPLWWVDPENSDTLDVDTQYLLGLNVVVAPIMERGVTSRRVVLPAGTWVDGNNGDVYEGGIILESYAAPVDVLPYFVRQGSSAEKILKNKGV